MTLVGSCSDASGTISNATAYTGLSTGMKIAPCVVFPSGATVTDIAVDGTNFTVTPVSSEEAWKYTFTLYEPKAGGAAIVYVEAVAVSAAVAGILISGAVVMLQSSFLEKAKAEATIGGSNTPFSFHCSNIASANAEIVGHLVFVQASGLNSATANAKATATANRYLVVSSSTPVNAVAVISGLNIYV